MRKTHSLQEVAAVEQERDEALRELRHVKAELDRLLTPRHIDEWHEDMHDVVWWRDPIDEGPHIGSPLDLGREVVVVLGTIDGNLGQIRRNIGGWKDGYYKWFTPLPTNESVDIIQSRIDAAKKAREASNG